MALDREGLPRVPEVLSRTGVVVEKRPAVPGAGEAMTGIGA